MEGVNCCGRTVNRKGNKCLWNLCYIQVVIDDFKGIFIEIQKAVASHWKVTLMIEKFNVIRPAIIKNKAVVIEMIKSRLAGNNGLYSPNGGHEHGCSNDIHQKNIFYTLLT